MGAFPPTLELPFLFPTIDVYKERSEMTLQSLMHQSHEPHHTWERSNEMIFFHFSACIFPS